MNREDGRERKNDRERGSRVLAAISVMTLLACGFIVWNVTPESRSDASLVLKKRPMQLLDGVYMLGSLSPSVAYVIDTSEGLVLIDSGLEADCTALLQQIKYLQLDPARIKKVLLTHAHGDHVLGAMYLARLTGAQVYAGKGDVDVLRLGGPREALFSTYDMPDVDTHATEIDVPLEGGETIELGDVQIRVIATPGHTPGSLCFLLEHDDHRILFTGDTISTITGDLGTYGTYLPPRFRSDAGDYLASLKTLRKLEPPDVLLPGHPQIGLAPSMMPPAMPAGGMMPEEEGIAAEVTREQWHAMLDAGIQEMQVLLKRFGRDGRDFLDGKPIRILDGLFYLGEFSDAAVYVVKDRDRLILFDPPPGAGFLQFLEQQLGQLGETLKDVSAVALTSCDPETSGGLLGVVQKYNPLVFVSRQGVPILRERLTRNYRLVVAETFDGGSEWPFRTIAVAGRGVAPMAYALELDGKRVLISGQIPSRLGSRSKLQEFLRDLGATEGDAAAFLDSIDLLKPLQPDIWLPTHPVNGQNANLYDEQWNKVLERNREAIQKGSGR